MCQKYWPFFIFIFQHLVCDYTKLTIWLILKDKNIFGKVFKSSVNLQISLLMEILWLFVVFCLFFSWKLIHSDTLSLEYFHRLFDRINVMIKKKENTKLWCEMMGLINSSVSPLLIFWKIAAKGGPEKAISNYLKEISAVLLVLRKAQPNQLCIRIWNKYIFFALVSRHKKTIQHYIKFLFLVLIDIFHTQSH